MIIDLESIFNVEGLSVQLDYDLDLSGEELEGVYPFRTPVHVKGAVSNETGIVEINAVASFDFTIPCSRCAAEYTETMEVDVCHTLVRSVNNEDNDDLMQVTDLRFDVDPLVTEDIFLALPFKFLCSEDCKGLCVKCGKNLNDGPCSCKSDTDPRWDALLQLLDN